MKIFKNLLQNEVTYRKNICLEIQYQNIYFKRNTAVPHFLPIKKATRGS